MRAKRRCPAAASAACRTCAHVHRVCAPSFCRPITLRAQAAFLDWGRNVKYGRMETQHSRMELLEEIDVLRTLNKARLTPHPPTHTHLWQTRRTFAETLRDPGGGARGTDRDGRRAQRRDRRRSGAARGGDLRHGGHRAHDDVAYARRGRDRATAGGSAWVWVGLWVSVCGGERERAQIAPDNGGGARRLLWTGRPGFTPLRYGGFWRLRKTSDFRTGARARARTLWTCVCACLRRGRRGLREIAVHAGTLARAAADASPTATSAPPAPPDAASTATLDSVFTTVSLDDWLTALDVTALPALSMGAPMQTEGRVIPVTGSVPPCDPSQRPSGGGGGGGGGGDESEEARVAAGEGLHGPLEVPPGFAWTPPPQRVAHSEFARKRQRRWSLDGGCAARAVSGAFHLPPPGHVAPELRRYLPAWAFNADGGALDMPIAVSHEVDGGGGRRAPYSGEVDMGGAAAADAGLHGRRRIAWVTAEDALVLQVRRPHRRPRLPAARVVWCGFAPFQCVVRVRAWHPVSLSLPCDATMFRICVFCVSGFASQCATGTHVSPTRN